MHLVFTQACIFTRHFIRDCMTLLELYDFTRNVSSFGIVLSARGALDNF